MSHRATAVASRAILLAIQEGAFRATDVRRDLDDPPSASTVTRVLQQLEEDGWLGRNADGSDIWRAGFKARTHGDMSDAARSAADRDAVQPGKESEHTDSFDFSW
ncbi:helix-turn-helix domain-containing protein [Halorientalis regularis]|uniref:IclR helix-turn-helix domain-containing protein n=1 Tax=Halorientalis regularis TaxID=660518 RepID=A0A1G7UCC9_9EURY|nr:hypothetical protein [Halorientalis regularis]SDG45117.1 hypothetical protein SAMN05216218_1491 [Halorientalis regularis]